MEFLNLFNPFRKTVVTTAQVVESTSKLIRSGDLIPKGYRTLTSDRSDYNHETVAQNLLDVYRKNNLEKI